MTRLNVPYLVAVCLSLASGRLQSENAASAVRSFIDRHCVECHDSDAKKGGLDLSTLSYDLKGSRVFSTWVKVCDRVAAGEMPPKKKPRPAVPELNRFTNILFSALFTADRERIKQEGRATQRRLNRYEYEETLRDLLALPYLEVKSFLPEDSEAYGFNKAGDALDVSHVQMARYLSAAEFALREAVAPQAHRPTATTNRFYTWDQGAFFGAIKLEGPLNRRTFPLIGYELQRELMAMDKPRRDSTDPERRDQEALAVVVSTYEPTEIRFNKFRAPVSGKYRLRFCAYSIWMGPKYTEVTPGHQSEPVTIYAETPPRLLRKLGSFDVAPEPTMGEMQVYLLAGETIRPDAARLFRSRPPDHKNPLAGPDGMPGVAFRWMDVEGPFFDQWPPAGHRLMFADLPLHDPPQTMEAEGEISRPAVSVESKHPEQDAEKLLQAFMEAAYRHPIQKADVDRFLSVVRCALKSGQSFTDAMIAGYTGVLSSPGFLYFNEKPGRLDDWALAERLSYFLWNSCPDRELRELARRNELHRRKVLEQQTERLLNDPRCSQFIDAFLDYWLDLRYIAGTAPDEALYPEYQLDDLLVESMIDETQLFFAELVKRNLGVKNLVDADFAILNTRLAAHYGIEGVEGVGMRPVNLPEKSLRGGLLTQASVLKVTANGTTTSPVKRGAWIMGRVLGKPPPPPPPSVPALEPDIRGATTIREQLAKHRSQETCAACHRSFDPVGFALESFDVMGGWRDRYRSVGSGDPVKGIGHNGLNFHYSLGQAIDAGGELPDGRKFQDVIELKQLLLKDDEQLARNLAQQLAVYATGAPIQFSDRPQIAQLLVKSRSEGYGVRTLIREIVQSDLFLNK